MVLKAWDSHATSCANMLQAGQSQFSSFLPPTVLPPFLLKELSSHLAPPPPGDLPAPVSDLRDLSHCEDGQQPGAGHGQHHCRDQGPVRRNCEPQQSRGGGLVPVPGEAQVGQGYPRPTTPQEMGEEIMRAMPHHNSKPHKPQPLLFLPSLRPEHVGGNPTESTGLSLGCQGVPALFTTKSLEVLL